MLVLSRKNNESIVIGDDIVVTIMDVGRGRVQVGITAPGHVPIFRHEIVERMIARGEIDHMGELSSTREAVGAS